jgi:hypothetical protein
MEANARTEWRDRHSRKKRKNMRLLLILGLIFFFGFYVLGAALIARAWWLSGRSSTQASVEPKSPSQASEATRTRAA